MTGCLNIGRPGTQVVDGVIASARRHGLPSEVLPSDAMRSRFPAFALPESHVGVYQPTAGVLNADACVGALVDASVARGATIRHGELVNNWEPDGDGVIVRTPSGTIRAQKLVITAGPWSASVLADLGLPLQAVRQYVVHFEPQAPERFSPPGFPAFIWDVAEGEVYGIPYLPGSGFKVGGHDPGEPCTPETARRTVTAEEIENVRSIFERCLPGCATTMSMAATCLYTVTPDRHFIIDRHPEHPQVSYAAGFSGHGFKFGPTIGEVLADLAIEGSSRHDVAFLRAARFPAAS
ncbi:MAG: N-methyl-L-tryptophan oxidase [Proteobacteria bacterium]|nr:N-methyl-L-tryptophan oxidase [Pseudomonadota bacterium]